MKILVIVGPTASGKSALALKVAGTTPSEIIGCDSVQVYRGFDIGAAKPTDAERRVAPHRLIDIVNWNEEFDAGIYAHHARAAVAEVRKRGRLPIVVGGTGLYLRALLGENFHEALPKNAALRERLARRTNESLVRLLQRLNPERAAQIHPNDRVRLLRALELTVLQQEGAIPKALPSMETRMEPTIVRIDLPRAELHRRIAIRVEEMLQGGLIEEVRRLLDNGCPVEAKPMQSIGYKQVAQFLRGDLGESELRDKIIFATRQYAKRQNTWFKRLASNLILDSTEAVNPSDWPFLQQLTN